MIKRFVGKGVIALLILGLMVLSGCASTDQSGGTRYPADDQSPMWYRISPPGSGAS